MRELSCCMVIDCSNILFFQAEDGIRDLVRSRGLGDVYKRQFWNQREQFRRLQQGLELRRPWGEPACQASICVLSVSYTHLTLPTSDLV